MRITHFEIRNFRSIRQLACSVGEMTVFLGPNNHGKSNILAALDFLLNPGTKVTLEDFCSSRPTDENFLEVEAVFAELTDQELITFTKYIRADQTLRIKRMAWIGEDGKIEHVHKGYVQEPDVWWLQETASDRLGSRDAVTEAAREVQELTALLDEPGRITKTRLQEFQATYIQENRDNLTFNETLENGPLLGAKNIGGGVLPDFYLIPAVRDLTEETKTTGTATFGRLLQRAVAEMTARDERFIELQERLSGLVDELNQRDEDPAAEPTTELARLERRIKLELDSWGVGVNIQVKPPEIRKVLELGTELWIDDGHPTLADRKGHGLQRAIIFSLIKAWSSVIQSAPDPEATRPRAASESIIFAYEEPELFLHPHAQRILADSLRAIADTPEHQVFICTHSTHFVDLDHYRAIKVVHRPSLETGTLIKECTGDLFEGEENRDRKRRFQMASWINPDRGELFFANKVILVEGESEKVVLPYLAKKLGCFDQTVSVIDCGSKHNLPLYIEILNVFSMKYVVVHDEDPLPDQIPTDWSDDKIREKRRTFELNNEIGGLVSQRMGRVVLLSPDFERFSGVPRAQGEKKGKPLAALDHFAALELADIPEHVQDMIRKIYS